MVGVNYYRISLLNRACNVIPRQRGLAYPDNFCQLRAAANGWHLVQIDSADSNGIQNLPGTIAQAFSRFNMPNKYQTTRCFCSPGSTLPAARNPLNADYGPKRI
jgi:hypothetical protein